MRFAVLGSGSKGNSVVVESADTRLLVDAGFSARQLRTRLKSLGVEAASLSGVLLTHEHKDHTRGLSVLCSGSSLPVYATPHTRRMVANAGAADATWTEFEAGQAFRIGGIAVNSFPVHHDAADPVGFAFCSVGERRLGLVLDSGNVTEVMTKHLADLHALFVESNYDEALLDADAKRPWALKQRISSRHGHLSNGQAADLAARVLHPGLARIVLGHLSSDCNNAEAALAAMRTRLGEHTPELHCAAQEEPSPWFTV
jgi:phosphoribosyl 1,2-cyclic phosphodiesterase